MNNDEIRAMEAELTHRDRHRAGLAQDAIETKHDPKTDNLLLAGMVVEHLKRRKFHLKIWVKNCLQ